MSTAMDLYLRVKNDINQSNFDEKQLYEYYTLRNACAVMAIGQESLRSGRVRTRDATELNGAESS